jgi:PPE-repeat protein
MDFAFLPPEINSARMYAGPGSASMLAAASSWNSLAAELGTTAEAYESVLSSLSLQWQGPASEAMAASAARYIEWMLSTAQQAGQTAMQATAAAAAYERAHAMTVPPPAVTANRSLLAELIATNLVGQNTAAIAATEAQYADFWIQDATAMSSYAASSSSATQLTPFSTPTTESANESGLAAQAASVARATASPAASDPVSQLVQTVTQALQAFAANPLAIIPDDLSILDIIAATGTSINSTYYLEAFAAGVIGAENNLGVLPKAGAAAAAEVAPAAPVAAALRSAPVGAGLGNITATLTGGGTIGPLSVPASWAAPSTTRITALTPAGFTTIPGTEEAAAAGYPGYPGLPGASRASGVGAPPRYGVKLTVMPRPPAAG